MWGRRLRGLKLERVALWATVIAVPIAVLGTVVTAWPERGDDESAVNELGTSGQTPSSAAPPTTNAPTTTSDLSAEPIFTYFSEAGTYLVSRSVDELPTPPEYDSHATLAHCDRWDEYFAQLSAARLNDTGFIEMTARDVSFSLVDITAKVLRSYPVPEKHTLISCQMGAGGFDATLAQFDLRTSPADVYLVDIDGEEFDLPPDTYHVEAGLTENLILSPELDQLTIYELLFDLTVVLNGERKTYQVGSESEPIRFVVYPDGGLLREVSVDWDLDARSWVEAGALYDAFYESEP